jgi:hypothetical protein
MVSAYVLNETHEIVACNFEYLISRLDRFRSMPNGTTMMSEEGRGNFVSPSKVFIKYLVGSTR